MVIDVDELDLMPIILVLAGMLLAAVTITAIGTVIVARRTNSVNPLGCVTSFAFVVSIEVFALVVWQFFNDERTLVVGAWALGCVIVGGLAYWGLQRD